jgi:hypothetical protein
MKEGRPNLRSIQVDLGWAVKYAGAVLGCGLGAQALARIGAGRFTLFIAVELLVGAGTILLLRPPTQLQAVAMILLWPA